MCWAISTRWGPVWATDGTSRVARVSTSESTQPLLLRAHMLHLKILQQRHAHSLIASTRHTHGTIYTHSRTVGCVADHSPVPRTWHRRHREVPSRTCQRCGCSEKLPQLPEEVPLRLPLLGGNLCDNVRLCYPLGSVRCERNAINQLNIISSDRCPLCSPSESTTRQCRSGVLASRVVLCETRVLDSIAHTWSWFLT